MSTMQVAIPAPLDAFVEEQVRAGAYPDAQSVVEAGLRRLALASETDAERRARFWSAIQVGLDQSERAESKTIADVSSHFDRLEAEAASD